MRCKITYRVSHETVPTCFFNFTLTSICWTESFCGVNLSCFGFVFINKRFLLDKDIFTRGGSVNGYQCTHFLSDRTVPMGDVVLAPYKICLKGANHFIFSPQQDNVKIYSFGEDTTWWRHIMACDVILAPFSKFVALFPKIWWRQQKCSLYKWIISNVL